MTIFAVAEKIRNEDASGVQPKIQNVKLRFYILAAIAACIASYACDSYVQSYIATAGPLCETFSNDILTDERNIRILSDIGVGALEDNGVKCKVLTSIRMEPIGEYYSKARAIEYLEAGYVVIIGGGTSNPYFTTDSAAALRGIEIEADILLKGTRVDGVYTADPEKDPTAVKFDEISFEEVLDRRLKVMDLTAFTLCRENRLEILVFDMDTVGNLGKVLAGEGIGTRVKL